MSSWKRFFADAMRDSLAIEASVRGCSAKITALELVFFTKVIPRLLGALEHEWREVKPCLLRGDLWRENFSELAQTGELMVFDACAFWGHKECMGNYIIFLC